MLLSFLAGQAAMSQTAPGGSAPPAGRLIDFNNNLWLSYSGDHVVSGRWGLHFDGHWRRAELGTTWQQFLFRPGVNFALSRSVSLSGGYAYIKTYPYGDYRARTTVEEHRTHQQVVFRHAGQSASVQHRVRLEQRFVRYPDPQPRRWTYQNRVRYLIRADLPLAKAAGGRTSWYVPISNEVFIGIAPNYGARPFDQNRLTISIGRALAAARVEVGYMKHFVGQRNGRIFEFNNTFLITVSSNVSLGRVFGN